MKLVIPISHGGGSGSDDSRTYFPYLSHPLLWSVCSRMVSLTTLWTLNTLNDPLGRYRKAIQDQSEADRLWRVRSGRTISSTDNWADVVTAILDSLL